MSQLDLFENDAALTLLDGLLDASRLYRRTEDYAALLNFVVRLRNFAPFNAMLLQIQKPGLSYAASAVDWQVRFGRTIKRNARPLLILWPCGPVAFVYDVLDTTGRPLPRDVAGFCATGTITASAMVEFKFRLKKPGIAIEYFDGGDFYAGMIEPLAPQQGGKQRYRLQLNKNHSAAVQFSSLAHELGHLYLGHLGANADLSIPERSHLSHRVREVEAESVAYLVCHRNGVTVNSDRYIAMLVDRGQSLEGMAHYQIMRAAGQIESVLGLGARTVIEMPISKRKKALQPDGQARLAL